MEKKFLRNWYWEKNLQKTKIKNILFANEKNNIPTNITNKINNLKNNFILKKQIIKKPSRC